MNLLARVERRRSDRRESRLDGRRRDDERPALSIVEACRELGIPTVGGNGRLEEPS